MNILALDFETSISKTCHGPEFREPTNDIYTQIWATNEDWVGLAHAPKGWKRTLYDKIADELHHTDYVIGHNMGFDLCYIWHDPALRAYILRGGKIWCTQYAAYILSGQQHAFSSLAELQFKELGEVEKPSRITFLFKLGIGADKIVQARERCPRLWKLYEAYCRTDGSTPIKIFKKQYAQAVRTKMLAIIELHNDYLLSICNMVCTGIKIDVVKCEKTLRDFNLKHLEYLAQAQEVLTKYWTDSRLPTFNINSPDHKSAVLFGGNIKIVEREQIGTYKNGNPRFKNVDKLVRVDGFRVPTSLSRRGKKPGLYSTDDAVMIKIGDGTKNPLLKQYCELQKQAMMYKKAAKTYCQAFLDMSVDGILYPNFNNCVTPTGRPSASNPNTQNIPSKGELASAIEGLLVAPPGWVCVSTDFSQLEKWVQAWMSSDPVLTERLLAGYCLHCFALSQKEKIPYEEVYRLAVIEEVPEWVQKRKKIKPVSFQMDYGAMPPKVVLTTGLPLEEVEEIFAIDKELYPQKHYFFGEYLQEEIKKTATLSLEKNIPNARKKGKEGSKFYNGVELLPIFDKAGNLAYTNSEQRRIGYWQTNYGKLYHFADTGRYRGMFEHKVVGKKDLYFIPPEAKISRSFSFTQPKNYPNQGGGSDIQAATSAEILRACLTKADRIKMILEIHDSKRFYIREDVLEPCCKWLKEVIEDVPAIFMRRFGIEVPFKFPVGFEKGYDFGEMEKYDV